MDWRREGQYSAGNIDHKYAQSRSTNIQELRVIFYSVEECESVTEKRIEG